MNTYPMTITATKRITRRTDRNGKAYVSTRMLVAANDREPAERTVRIFGPLVGIAIAALKKGVPVHARVAYDSFVGEDGSKGQSVRLVSLDKAA